MPDVLRIIVSHQGLCIKVDPASAERYKITTKEVEGCKVTEIALQNVTLQIIDTRGSGNS